MAKNVSYGPAEGNSSITSESINSTAHSVIQKLLQQAGSATTSQEALHFTQAACNAANALNAITR